MAPDAGATPPEELETRFLAALESSPIPVDTLVGVLRFLQTSGQSSTAENWTELLQETLVARGDGPGLVRLFRFRAAGCDADRAFGTACLEVLRRAWKDRDTAAFLDAAGFGTLPPGESLRRLEWLLACRPGTLCLDNTWGFGTVQRLDFFYKKVLVDFATRPGHPMSFAYAAESLAPVDDTHLLVRHHRDPEGFARLVSERPDEVVRLALRCFGPLSVVRLEALLAEHKLVATADWKRFWDQARKALKTDPQVTIPAKRTEPIVLHAVARDYGEAWLKAFARERDIARLIEGVEGACAAAGGAPADAARTVLTERLAFGIKGALNTDPALYARLAALVAQTGLAAAPLDVLRAHLWEGNRFLAAAERLSGRDTARLVSLLTADADAAPRLLAVLAEMPFSLLSETLAALREGPALAAAQQRCHELLAAPQAPPTLVVWIFRNRDSLAGWRLPGLGELLAHAVRLVEERLSGEALRMQNQMRQLFQQASWIEGVLHELDAPGRHALFDRLQASAGWDAAARHMVAARMIKLDPSLAARRRHAVAAADTAAPRLTSWRSLLERRVQHKRLVEVEMPRNSQDIATARSYGDLRENFEYQAAKDQQTLLLQRQSELARDLKQVHGSGFAGAAADRVGMGVRVTLAYPDGRTQRVCILGEWDRDEALGIISCQSRLAKCLEGHVVGDTVPVPGETGDEPARLAAIEPLDDAIRAWIGPPAADGG